QIIYLNHQTSSGKQAVPPSQKEKRTMKQAIVQSLLIHQAIPEFQEWLSIRGMSGETLRGYHVDINQFSNWISSKANGPVIIDEITVRRIEEFIGYLTHEKGCKP